MLTSGLHLRALCFPAHAFPKLLQKVLPSSYANRVETLAFTMFS